MVDTPALGAGRGNPVKVQVLSTAPEWNLAAFSKPNNVARSARRGSGLDLNFNVYFSVYTLTPLIYFWTPCES